MRTALVPSPAAPDTLPANTPRPEEGKAWNCYPNPTADVLHVELESGVRELFITDVTGKLVLRATPAHRKVTLQLGHFPTGIYFLTFYTGQKWEKARFLVSR